jgi:hypothetical protein
VQCLEAAFRRTSPQRRPGSHRPADTLEVSRPEVLELKQIAKKSPGAFGDHNHIRLGDPLQARREVRRVADDRPLLGGTHADQIADHDKPGRNADTHLQGRAGHGRELRHRLDQPKPGTHSAFGVMLVGPGITEIGKHPVAHILGDEPPGLGDLFGAATVIGTDDLPHVLGVKASRERGRANEVDKHDRELATLSSVLGLGLGRWRQRSGARDGTAEVGDRRQHLPPMSEQDAQRCQIGIGQMPQDGDVDTILAKALGVLAQTETPQPFRNLLHRRPGIDRGLTALSNQAK